MLLILNNIQKEDRGDGFLIKQDRIHAGVMLNSIHLVCGSISDVCVTALLYLHSRVLNMARRLKLAIPFIPRK